MPDVADDVDEHPIIFNEWSINRILDAEKSQTRRIVKPQPDGPAKTAEQAGDGSWYWVPVHGTAQTAPGEAFRCPHGKSGDVLWVREAFRMPARHDGQYTPKEYVSRSGYTQGMPGRFKYEADGKRAYEVAGNPDGCAVEWGRKRPAIHMPRELCRLRLRVEDVRVERVQEITAEGARAEGMSDDQPDAIARSQFHNLWNDIHGDSAWERNDWVWVVEFSRINE